MAQPRPRESSPPPRPGPAPRRLLAVDPGRDKCGLAVVDSREGILARGVVPATMVGRLAEDWVRAYRPEILVVGGGTALRAVRRALEAVDLPMQVFPESHTTERARRRYFQEHPPRGLWRLVPLGLRTPPVPVDDYAAVLIAEDFLAGAGS